MSEKANPPQGSATTQMSIRKRNGQLEPVNLEKILKAVTRSGKGLSGVDCYRVAAKTIGGIYDGASTQELDKLSIETAASFIPEHGDYSKLAAALLAEFIRKEVASQGIESFSQSFFEAQRLGLVGEYLVSVKDSARKLDNAIDDSNNLSFEYYALRAVYETHLLRNPQTGKVIETPQQAFMRLAVRQSTSTTTAVKEYRQIAKGDISIVWDSKRYNPLEPLGAKSDIFERQLMPGMGQAVAERTILRKDAEGTWETWGDVANRVALGNSLLASTANHPSDSEYRTLRRHIAKGNTLMSGRHLQHGDVDQPNRPQEVFTNCSTAAASFIEFYLLLNGSGVGRCYDDDMMLVNWDDAPNVRCVLDTDHADFLWGTHESLRDARHKYEGPNVIWFDVQDSREGWAKALELWEFLAYEKVHKDKLLVLNFTPVRKKGDPIGGMQNRPASGPVPLMNAFLSAAQLKGSGLPRWKQTLYIDHYFAECVLVGGARRAARMSTKQWSDPTVLDFITVKRPLEYVGKSVQEIIRIRADRAAAGLPQFQGFLWSSNNSLTVDEEFWEAVRKPNSLQLTPTELHAKAVYALATEAAYADGTGEPGFINSHKLVSKDKGLAELSKSEYVESKKYKLNEDTHLLMSRLAKKARAKKWKMIVNPCGEIQLFVLGAFCVIADVVPFHADTLDEAEEAFRASTRALIRVNLMDSIYNKEVKRTNRIGVGITGIHEFAWKFFGFGFRDLIDEQKSQAFWLTLARFNRAVAEEARSYAAELGVEIPHTMTTIKPAGCRPWHGLVTTDRGLLTLQEMLEHHPDDNTWGTVLETTNAVQDDGVMHPITRTFVNGKAEVMQVRLAYGLCVESTRNHPWMVKSIHRSKKLIPVDKWVKTEDLKPGMVLAVNVGVYTKRTHTALHHLSTLALRMRGDNNPIRQPKELNPDLAWFLGYLWGDGAMSSVKFRLRWTDQKLENLEKVNRIFNEQFGISGEITPAKNKDASILEVGNKELWHWLLRNGVYKYHAEDIDILPRVVRESSQEDILAFLAGLLDADGSICVTARDKTPMLSQMDYRLCRHVQDIGWAVGIAFGMSHNTVGENFQKTRKSMYLMAVSSASTIEALDIMAKHSNKMSSAPTHVPWRHNYVGKKHRRILGKVEKVVSLGEMETFDVEVPSNQQFYAGSVKSHNTTSKLFGLTEGWHLPAMAFWLRWVQFRNDDPLVQNYKGNGYPTRELKTYSGTTIVGFPTAPTIATLGLGDKLVTAGEATPEEQFQWLMLGEKYWIQGTNEVGIPVAENYGNQISYCLAGDGEHLIATSKGMFRIETLMVNGATVKEQK